MALLDVRDLWVAYGQILALRGVSLAVERGQIVALIGANGAGKTTTLNAICGLRAIRNGRVVLDGQDLAHVPAHRLPALGLVQVPEGRRIFGRLTVMENLRMGAFSRRDGEDAVGRDLERVFELFPRLRERRDQLGGTLSGGEQQMLGIGRALMASPKMLLLDEPSMGLAPRLVDQIFDAVRAVNEQGVTVLLVEQNAFMALEIADLAYVLESGEVVLEGKGLDLLEDEAVKRAYLG
jgi:branched-chain amino acid transport system ATP-binding protein